MLRADMSNISDMKKKGQSLANVIDPDFVQREKERLQRAQLNSSDGDAVELHDQVNWLIIYSNASALTTLFSSVLSGS